MSYYHFEEEPEEPSPEGSILHTQCLPCPEVHSTLRIPKHLLLPCSALPHLRAGLMTEVVGCGSLWK